MHVCIPLDGFMLYIPLLLNQFPIAVYVGPVLIFFTVMVNIIIHKFPFNSLG